MIVKTGANYQAEGGYIEFAADNPNGVTIINGRAVPTKLYATASEITGFMSVEARKTPESSGRIRVVRYVEFVSTEGVRFLGTNSYETTTEANFIKIPIGYGASVDVPSGMKPVLADGSKDVRIITTQTSYYLIITGENPVAVLSYTEV